MKDAQENVTVDFTRWHFWGLYRVQEHIEGVKNLTLRSSLVDRVGWRHALMSGVFIQTDSQAVRLFPGSSNIDDGLKWDVVNTINDDNDHPGEVDFSRTCRVRNIFLAG